MFDATGRLPPDDLRSVDAIHVAGVRTLGDGLAGVVAYDDRLLRAATQHGTKVVSPGSEA